MKHCKKCATVKPLSEFGNNKSAKDGLQAYCKPCTRAGNRASAAKDPQKAKARSAAWAAANPERYRQGKARWKAANPEKVKAQAQKDYLSNKDAVNARAKEWAKKNPEKVRTALRSWRTRNRDECLARSRQWQLENPEKAAAHTAKRRALKLQRTPGWVNDTELAEIEALYIWARELSVSSGIEHEVDHYYPLQGKRVSGLHVLANLRVVTAEENRRKSNRHPE